MGSGDSAIFSLRLAREAGHLCACYSEGMGPVLAVALEINARVLYGGYADMFVYGGVYSDLGNVERTTVTLRRHWRTYWYIFR